MKLEIIWQGDTVLHVLCVSGRTELVQQLLEKGVDYTILNKVTLFSDGSVTFILHYYGFI